MPCNMYRLVLGPIASRQDLRRSWYSFLHQASFPATVRFGCLAVGSKIAGTCTRSEMISTTAVSHEPPRVRQLQKPIHSLNFPYITIKPEHAKLPRYRDQFSVAAGLPPNGFLTLQPAACRGGKYCACRQVGKFSRELNGTRRYSVEGPARQKFRPYKKGFHWQELVCRKSGYQTLGYLPCSLSLYSTSTAGDGPCFAHSFDCANRPVRFSTD